MMVRADHTAIYTRGRNDASPAVQARLRSLDANGRSCGAPSTTTSRRPAPLHRGEPGYSPKLDRDGDVIACE